MGVFIKVFLERFPENGKCNLNVGSIIPSAGPELNKKASRVLSSISLGSDYGFSAAGHLTHLLSTILRDYNLKLSQVSSPFSRRSCCVFYPSNKDM